jgi:hypothetical protein
MSMLYHQEREQSMGSQFYLLAYKESQVSVSRDVKSFWVFMKFDSLCYATKAKWLKKKEGRKKPCYVFLKHNW